MSKPVTPSAIVSKLFGGSDKVISEKLSVDEHAVFAAEVSELNSQLETMSSENATIAANLVTANESVLKLTGDLATAQSSVSTLTASLTEMTGERDKFKTQHEKSASKGDQNPNEDENSRRESAKAGYNDHALSVWHKAHA